MDSTAGPHMTTYLFAKQFTRSPGGRKRVHGKHSGEEFFETVLVPRHEQDERTVLDLSGVRGFATSFLDGAFGEFASTFGIARFHELFEVKVDDDDELIEDIEKAMERAVQSKE